MQIDPGSEYSLAQNNEQVPSQFPPGLVGEIAEFVYNAAPRPVALIALAAGIAYMAGICGRAYNVKNTGLNQYILVAAATGVNKDAIASGLSKLNFAVKASVPGITSFQGPGDFTSSTAVIRALHKQSCFLSIHSS